MLDTLDANHVFLLTRDYLSVPMGTLVMLCCLEFQSNELLIKYLLYLVPDTSHS